MFFDCTGLLAGLAASVITKWKANDKYSYGYVRAEVLAGFVNSLFLLFIAFFILSEGVERAIEPPEVCVQFETINIKHIDKWLTSNTCEIWMVGVLHLVLSILAYNCVRCKV